MYRQQETIIYIGKVGDANPKLHKIEHPEKTGQGSHSETVFIPDKDDLKIIRQATGIRTFVHLITYEKKEFRTLKLFSAGDELSVEETPDEKTQ